jgi:hypothetical protein
VLSLAMIVAVGIVGEATSAAAVSISPLRQAEAEPDEPRAPHLVPPLPRPRSKKELWLAQKIVRPIHLGNDELRRGLSYTKRRPAAKTAVVQDPPAPAGATVRPITTLFNLWTREALPLLPGRPVDAQFHPFLRDHYTNQATRMDVRLLEVLSTVARQFKAARIEVVSGYRSPKYNLMLRKKGHEVARTSQHTQGNAVDFRIRGVPPKNLLRFVRSLRRGGVGFYPRSQFVHSDTGRVRFWKGS